MLLRPPPHPPYQEEDIVYYDAKADAELVSAPSAGEGRSHTPLWASGLCREGVRMRVGLSTLGF